MNEFYNDNDSSMENSSNDGNTIETELQVRLMNLVMGEASDFERDQLQLMMEQRSELAAFYEHLKHLHGLLCEVGTGDPSTGEEQSIGEDAWKLPTDRREQLLSVIDGDTDKSTESLDGKVVAASTRSRFWKMLTPKWIAAGAVVASLCFLFGRIFLPRMQTVVFMAGTRHEYQLSAPDVASAPAGYYWADDVQATTSAEAGRKVSKPLSGQMDRINTRGSEEKIVGPISQTRPELFMAQGGQSAPSISGPAVVALSDGASDMKYRIDSVDQGKSAIELGVGDNDGNGVATETFAWSDRSIADNSFGKELSQPSTTFASQLPKSETPQAGNSNDGLAMAQDRSTRIAGDSSYTREHVNANPDATVSTGRIIDESELVFMERRLKHGQITEVESTKDEPPGVEVRRGTASMDDGTTTDNFFAGGRRNGMPSIGKPSGAMPSNGEDTVGKNGNSYGEKGAGEFGMGGMGGGDGRGVQGIGGGAGGAMQGMGGGRIGGEGSGNGQTLSSDKSSKFGTADAGLNRFTADFEGKPSEKGAGDFGLQDTSKGRGIEAGEKAQGVPAENERARHWSAIAPSRPNTEFEPGANGPQQPSSKPATSSGSALSVADGDAPAKRDEDVTEKDASEFSTLMKNGDFEEGIVAARKVSELASGSEVANLANRNSETKLSTPDLETRRTKQESGITLGMPSVDRSSIPLDDNLPMDSSVESARVTVPDGGTVLLGGIKTLRKSLQEGRSDSKGEIALPSIESPSFSAMDGRPPLSAMDKSEQQNKQFARDDKYAIQGQAATGEDASKLPNATRLNSHNSLSDNETSTLMMTVTPRIIIPEEEEEKIRANVYSNGEATYGLARYKEKDSVDSLEVIKQNEERLNKGYLLAPSPELASDVRKGKSLDAKPARPNPPALKPAAPKQAVSIDEQSAAVEAFSTFSLHVSDVSFKLAQTALSQGQWPDAAKIRIEEFVNALDYHDPLPSGNQKVACRVEQAIHPFLMQRNLLRVSMRTAATGRAQNTPLRLTLLLDNSGSMERPDRRAAVLRAFQTLTQQLTPADQVTLISFASTPRLLADKVPGNQGEKLLQLIETLPSEGGTNIESALLLAREKAAEQQLAGAQNRIVLLTDGAVNLGNANPDSLSKLVIQMRDSGIAFDAAGISAQDLNDEVLEALTRQGDGRYYLLDSAAAASDSFAAQIAGALRPSAQNVKVQVEFNPQRVGHYKLMGFEKHRLNKEDFRDDKVDAAELAAAEAGVAVYQYEIKPNGSGDVGSVSVRFRDVATGQMIENRWPIPYESNTARLDQAEPSMQLAATSALFAAKLAGGPLADSVDLPSLQKILTTLPAPFANQPRVQQLRTMIHQATTMGK